jgi:hypothetical protein
MRRSSITLAIITLALLMIPAVGMQFSDEVQWTAFDFVFAGILIFGTGFLFELARKKANNKAYTLASAVALAGIFLLIWVNGAVGIIGDSGINVLYGSVFLTGLIGSLIARFKPRGMAITLFATAIVQLLVPVVALLMNTPDFSPGVVHVFLLNGIFAGLFAVSGSLFRQAEVTGHS